jgi:hypothetical protein
MNHPLTAAPRPRAPHRAKPRPFSRELRHLGNRFARHPVPLADLFQAMPKRGVHFCLLLIALPFIGPVPLPGFSIPFGLLVTFLGAGLMVDQPPWLPRPLMKRQLSGAAFMRLMHGSSVLMEKLEKVLRPRWAFVERHAIFARAGGGLIMISGLFMMLPFPLPFSNSLPAWTVILLATGTLAHDGLFFFFGFISFILSVIFFAFVAAGGHATMEWLSAVWFVR